MSIGTKFMVIMALDLGTKKTGISVCDKNEILAYPLTTIKESDREKLVEKVIYHIKQSDSQLLIIGLPKNMNGTEGKSAQSALEFGNKLKKRIKIEIVFWDERQTTKSAIAYLNTTNTYGQKRKNLLDVVSSTIILQNYLNSKVFCLSG